MKIKNDISSLNDDQLNSLKYRINSLNEQFLNDYEYTQDEDSIQSIYDNKNIGLF